MPVIIRRATPDDTGAVADFNVRLAMETESKRLDIAVVRRGVAEAMTNPSHGIYFVADNGGSIVGQAMTTYEWSDWRNGQFWWIQSVYVSEAWRGRKVFTALYEHIMDLARSTPGVCGIRLYVEEKNERAQKTYQKLGMNQTGYRLLEVDFSGRVAE